MTAKTSFKEQGKKYTEAGYRRISRKGGVIARVDSSNWWQKLTTVEAWNKLPEEYRIDLEDHYRRKFTTDRLTIEPEIARYVKASGVDRTSVILSTKREVKNPVSATGFKKGDFVTRSSDKRNVLEVGFKRRTHLGLQYGCYTLLPTRQLVWAYERELTIKKGFAVPTFTAPKRQQKKEVIKTSADIPVEHIAKRSFAKDESTRKLHEKVILKDGTEFGFVYDMFELPEHIKQLARYIDSSGVLHTPAGRNTGISGGASSSTDGVRVRDASGAEYIVRAIGAGGGAGVGESGGGRGVARDPFALLARPEIDRAGADINIDLQLYPADSQLRSVGQSRPNFLANIGFDLIRDGLNTILRPRRDLPNNPQSNTQPANTNAEEGLREWVSGHRHQGAVAQLQRQNSDRIAESVDRAVAEAMRTHNISEDEPVGIVYGHYTPSPTPMGDRIWVHEGNVEGIVAGTMMIGDTPIRDFMPTMCIEIEGLRDGDGNLIPCPEHGLAGCVHQTPPSWGIDPARTDPADALAYAFRVTGQTMEPAVLEELRAYSNELVPSAPYRNTVLVIEDVPQHWQPPEGYITTGMYEGNTPEENYVRYSNGDDEIEVRGRYAFNHVRTYSFANVCN